MADKRCDKCGNQYQIVQSLHRFLCKGCETDEALVAYGVVSK